MIVTNVSASIKMSRQIDGGTWATVELGAEGQTAGPDDAPWQELQAILYEDLKNQIANLWVHARPQCNGNTTEPSNGHSPKQRIPMKRDANPDTGVIECPEHHKSSESDFGGLWCNTQMPEGSKNKWCTWRYGKPDRKKP